MGEAKLRKKLGIKDGFWTPPDLSARASRETVLWPSGRLGQARNGACVVCVERRGDSRTVLINNNNRCVFHTRAD